MEDGEDGTGEDPADERAAGEVDENRAAGEAGDGDLPSPEFEARLQVGDATFDSRDAALVRRVAEVGSLQGAAESLGRSYSRAHARISRLEEAAGPLVDRHRGGADGGGSRLTDGARSLLARFDRLRAALSGTARVEETVMVGTVRDREGELVTVETPPGDVRAVLSTEPGTAESTADVGARVEVTVRADAVTLYASGEAPRASGTSARNRFEGPVAAVEREEAVATVRVDLGAATPLAALLTGDSLQRLDLSTGDRVAASFKATATRATPAGTGADDKETG